MMRWRLPIIIAGLLVMAVAAAGAAQRPPARADLWDLKLGTRAESLPDAYIDYACGTNGGPPSLPLRGWRDFRRCAAEPSGLREVYFRYDDELEYWAKAHDYSTEIEMFSGTKIFGYPVVVSALFDADGVLAGIRIVSDPRDPSGRREEAYSLRNFLSARYGRDGWNCRQLAPDEGETPVGRTFIKEHCSKTIPDVGLAVLQTHFFRKKGQSEFDPQSGRETKDQFESLVRFELTLAR